MVVPVPIWTSTPVPVIPLPLPKVIFVELLIASTELFVMALLPIDPLAPPSPIWRVPCEMKVLLAELLAPVRIVVPLPSCWKRIEEFTPVMALVRVNVLVWLKLR